MSGGIVIGLLGENQDGEKYKKKDFFHGNIVKNSVILRLHNSLLQY